MADTLVEIRAHWTRNQRVGRRQHWVTRLMMPLRALIDPDDSSAAVIPGHGPLPGARLAREIAADQLRGGSGGVASSPDRTVRLIARARLSAAIRAGAASTAAATLASSSDRGPDVQRSVLVMPGSVTH